MLPNYTLIWYITEVFFNKALNPNSIHRRYKKPRVLQFIFEGVSQCRKRIIQPTPYPYTLQNFITYTTILLVMIPYPNILSKTLESCPKPENFRQSIRIEHRRPSNFVRQSNSTIMSLQSSKSSITSHVSSRLVWKSLLGSRIIWAGHGLS